MAESTRLHRLRDLLKDDPDDVMLRYGEAMELCSLGDDVAGARAFRDLIASKPDYVPSYLMLGQTLQRLNKIDESAAVLREGIATAQRVGDLHAAGEMDALLAMLE